MEISAIEHCPVRRIPQDSKPSEELEARPERIRGRGKAFSLRKKLKELEEQETEEQEEEELDPLDTNKDGVVDTQELKEAGILASPEFQSSAHFLSLLGVSEPDSDL